jgi:hypothetical protein
LEGAIDPKVLTRLELGATTGGTLEAITHDAVTVTLIGRPTEGLRRPQPPPAKGLANAESRSSVQSG